MSRFDRLYRDNFPFVWAAAHRCGAPADSVDDVVQDVFVTAYRRLDELRWEISPQGWLYGVTRNVAFRYRRSAARTARRNTAVAATAKRSDRPHHRQDAARALEAMLEKVEETQRETFVMAELLGMSGPEIAAELAIPLNTVYSRLRLARRRLTKLCGSESQLADEVAATKSSDQPSRKQLEQTYAALMPMVGSQWLPLKTSIVGGLKSAGLPLAAVSIAITSYAVTVATKSETPDEETVVAEPRSRERPYGPAPKPKPTPVAEPEPSVAAAGVAPAATDAPVAAPTPVAPASATPATADGGTADPLTAEVGLLDQAKAALDGGDTTKALTQLEEHARRFPNGQLAEARQATQVRALCKAGRVAEAELAADALHRAHPDSNLAQQTPKKCPTS
ncbi:MAG: sigma-70 family RNA polymerase sigma factor [Myxococcota bacterium]